MSFPELLYHFRFSNYYNWKVQWKKTREVIVITLLIKLYLSKLLYSNLVVNNMTPSFKAQRRKLEHCVCVCVCVCVYIKWLHEYFYFRLLRNWHSPSRFHTFFYNCRLNIILRWQMTKSVLTFLRDSSVLMRRERLIQSFL